MSQKMSWRAGFIFLTRELCQAEVDYFHPRLSSAATRSIRGRHFLLGSEHDIGRLQVAMNQAAFLGSGQSTCDLQSDLERESRLEAARFAAGGSRAIPLR